MPFHSGAAAAAIHPSISQPGRAWRGAVGCAGLLSLLLGCGGGAPADVSVLWRLADGRSCVDTSLVRTVAEVDGQTPRMSYDSRCNQRAELNRIAVPQVPPGARILLRGETLSQTAVYRGEVEVPSPPPPLLDVVLYPTGGN